MGDEAPEKQEFGGSSAVREDHWQRGRIQVHGSR